MVKFAILQTCVLLSAMAMAVPPANGQQGAGQEPQPTELADRVRVVSEVALVVNDPNVVMDDVFRMLDDLGFGVIANGLDEDLPTFNKAWYSTDGLIGYGSVSLNNLTFEIPLADRRELISELADAGIREPAAGTLFDFPDEVTLPIPFSGLFFHREDKHAGLTDDRLLVGKDQELIEEIVEAEQLAPMLDPLGRDIINRSGMTLISIPLETDNSEISLLGLLAIDTENPGEDISESELRWLQQLDAALSHFRFGLIGAKYHPKELLELRGCITLAKAAEGAEKAKPNDFSSLVDLQASQKRWLPDLGFERKNLVVAAAVNMIAFQNSAAPRAIPNVLLARMREQESFEYLKGNMLQMLTELSGDSWNDLTAARIGLYANDQDETGRAGRLAVIGVVDARDERELLSELKKLSQLTSPLMVGERASLRDDEIQRLVVQLVASDGNIAARAESRLRLAGDQALPALQKAQQSSDSDLRRESRRVFTRIQNASVTDAPIRNVTNPWFWTTLNPGLDFRQASGTLDGHTVHSIDIAPDPSRTDAENGEANASMEQTFGPRWNEIKLVQIGDHFVFMLGSNDALLKKVVANVASQSQLLMGPILGIGHGSKQGQFHLFFESTRLAQLTNSRFGRNRTPTDTVAWTCLNISERNIGIEAMIPTKQILPFLFGF